MGWGADLGLSFSFCEMGGTGEGLAGGSRAVGSVPLSGWWFPGRFYRFGLGGGCLVKPPGLSLAGGSVPLRGGLSRYWVV